MSADFHSPAFAEGENEARAGRFGLWIFIASEAMLFGSLLLVYEIMRFLYGQVFAEASRETLMWAGTLNTAVLLTSSAAMAIAVENDEAGGSARTTRIALVVTGLLGVVFLFIKGFEYLEEAEQGLLPIFASRRALQGHLPDASGAFFNIYLTLTGLHALHLLTGIGLVAWVAIRWSVPARIRTIRLGNVGVYWHFIDMIWVVLYPLLYLVH